MPTMKNVYLVLAVIGAVVPYLFFAQHVGQAGYDISVFVRALFVNPAASGFTADLVITSLVFWIAIFHRKRNGNGPKPWPFVIVNLAIGLSCALPAYLYFNEKMKDATPHHNAGAE
jgi:hypothetical protein